MIDTFDYQDTEGATPYPDPRRKKQPGPVDPLLDELMKTNEASPSAPSLPIVDSGALPPPVTSRTNTGAPSSPYAPSPAPAAVPSSAPANVGHDGTYNGMTREQWRDAWMGMGSGMTREQVDAWMAANGATKQAGNGTFLTPFGESLDLGTGYRSGNVSAGWTPVTGGAGADRNLGAGGGAGSGNGAGGNVPNDEIHRILMEELQGLRGPIDPNDPRLKGQVDAFRNEQSRASQQARSALTERANYQGLPTGYVDAGIQSGIEDAGLQTAKFQGELTQKEYENRRAELDRLMQMALSSSDGAAARELQAQIAELDRNQQNSQFYDTMGYNVNRDQNNLDYLMTQMLMNGGA